MIFEYPCMYLIQNILDDFRAQSFNEYALYNNTYIPPPFILPTNFLLPYPSPCLPYLTSQIDLLLPLICLTVRLQEPLKQTLSHIRSIISHFSRVSRSMQILRGKRKRETHSFSLNICIRE